MSHVSASYKTNRSRQADQGAVWDSISRKMERMELHSPSSAMADAYEQSEKLLEGYVQALKPVENQVGAVFGIHGKAVGLECFDSAVTYAKVHEKIVRSFAIDAMERKARKEQDFSRKQAESFLKGVLGSPMESFDALGLGQDVRVTSRTVRGGALVHGGRVLHLCAFRATDGSSGNGRGSRLVRSSQRGRR